MDAEWAGVAVTVVATVGGGLWGLNLWLSQRRDERRQETNRINTLYVNPMVFAAEDLQSRLYNIVDKHGLVPLRKKKAETDYSLELMYLVARYFAWEQLLLRFTSFASDPAVVKQTQTIRQDLASDRGGVDGWCIFRPVQTALGQEVTCWRQGEVGFADTITFLEFSKLWASGLGRDLGLENAVQTLQQAQKLADLPQRTVTRLADLQANLVDLLLELEHKTSHSIGMPFSVGRGEARLRSAKAGHQPDPISVAEEPSRSRRERGRGNN